MAPLDLTPYPHDNVIETLRTALWNDKGHTARLIKITQQTNFTLGDNHASVIHQELLQYSIDGGFLRQVSYVTKQNNKDMDGRMQKVLFEKEMGFYTTILPQLNGELTRLELPKLRIPSYLQGDDRPSYEVMVLEDLCAIDFKIGDRVTVMDESHTKIVLGELARMHASSVILMAGALNGVNIIEKSPALKELYVAFQEETLMKTTEFLPRNLDAGIEIALNCRKLVVAEYLRSIKPNCYERLLEQLQRSEKFNVICHGDCWSGNFLFKYGQDGSVDDCRMIDLQNTRLGSPALDLNYLFYCSMSAEVRRQHLDSFLAHYYASFASVMATAQRSMTFTLEELKEEFVRKNLFALLMGLMVIPLSVMSSEETKQLLDMSPVQWKRFVVAQASGGSTILKSRFIDMFDDLTQSGCIE